MLSTHGPCFSIFVLTAILGSCSCQIIKDNDLEVLAQKHARISSLLDSFNMLRLNYNNYKEFVIENPRNYSVILMLTALNRQRNCHGCQAAYDEFVVISTSLSQQIRKNQPLFLAYVDFDESPLVFNDLNQNTVPVFIHFPPALSTKTRNILDISRNGFSAEVLTRWIFTQTGIEIFIVRPPSYSGFMLISMLAAFVGVFFYLRPDNFALLFNRSTMQYACMILLFYMISGQVWNSIRKPPFMHSQEGRMVFLYPSNDFQLIGETIAVMATYVLVSSSIVILIDVSKSNGPGKRTMAITGLAMFAIFVSVSLSLFRRKYRGYPFSFLLK